MSSTKRSRAVGWITGGVLGLAAIRFVWSIVTASGNPRAYRAYYADESAFLATWQYPSVAVTWSCVLLVAEAVVLWFIVCRSLTPHLWRRALVCVALTVPAALIGMPFLMHAPPYLGFHILWLVTIAALAILTFAAGRAAASWHFTRSARNGEWHRDHGSPQPRGDTPSSSSSRHSISMQRAPNWSPMGR